MIPRPNERMLKVQRSQAAAARAAGQGAFDCGMLAAMKTRAMSHAGRR